MSCRAARRALLLAAGGLLAAACGSAPLEVPGPARPVTAPSGTPTASATATLSPSRPPPVLRPVGTPTPPAAYGPYELSREGLTVRLPVPTDWSLRPTARGVDFGDPTGNVLLRVEITPRTAPTAREGWEIAEVAFRGSLTGYRRLGLADVPDVGDSAADLTFTFERDGVTRRAIDRGVVVGRAGLAVYYSAPQDLYDRMAPVFDQASRGLELS